MPRSGAVFYSGRSAFSRPSPVYLLGLNPGGSPLLQREETIARDMDAAITRSSDEWSAYSDDSWKGKPPGTHGLQPRVIHMFSALGLPPCRVPASNVVFVRTARESDLRRESAELLNACWPVHQAVIQALGVRVCLCLGRTAGRWVRERLHADEPDGELREANARKWLSTSHRNADGMRVMTLTHPSIADWKAPESDPTPLVQDVLSRSAK